MASQTYTRPTAHTHRSQSYRTGDSMIYHQSMFLKRLSHTYPEVDKKHGGWRQKLGHMLESKPEQIVIFSLIVLDLLVICAQLFVIEPRQNACKTPTVDVVENMYGSTSHSSSSHHESSHEEHVLEIAAEVLDYISLSILCVLGLEVVLLLIAFDIDFFKQPLYILDALVIGASLFIELQQKSTAGSAGSLLIFFRLWRIVRIVHGVAMSVQEKNEDQIKMLEAEVATLVKEKMNLATKLDYLKKRYKKLVANSEQAEDALPKLPDIPSDATLPTRKTIRINEDNIDVSDDDEVVVGIRDDNDVRKPLVRPSPEYSTFKKKGRNN